MIYTFRTKDHPEANGREPQAGDQGWTLTFPLEEGGFLFVHTGRTGRDAMRAMLAMEYAPG